MFASGEGERVRVLGVDPGLTRCGLGVVDGGKGRTVRAVAVGVVRTPPDADLAHRLLGIADEVEAWLDRYRPEAVAVERVFAQHNVRTAMGTAQAGGVVALAAARRGLPVVFHTPSEVKAAVTGSGRADKAQVTGMVMRLLNLEVKPHPADAADALALAICHLWREPMRVRLAEAEARAAELARTHKARLAAAAKQAGGASAPAARRARTAPRQAAPKQGAPKAAPAKEKTKQDNTGAPR
jgi:crossover junction endodeoxyribonuclease RuvC